MRGQSKPVNARLELVETGSGFGVTRNSFAHQHEAGGAAGREALLHGRKYRREQVQAFLRSGIGDGEQDEIRVPETPVAA